MKNKVSRYRVVVSVSVFDPRDRGAAWELRSLPLPSITREEGTAYH